MKKKTYSRIFMIIMSLILMIFIGGCGKDKKKLDINAADLVEDNTNIFEKDNILKGNTEAVSSDQGNSYENTEGMYRIRVVDEDMDPVEGAMVQFCTDSTCKMATTDKDGIATFSDPPGEYEVHVPRLPDGYKKHATAYKTENKYSDMVIVVEKE